MKANLFENAGMCHSYYCSESAIHHHHAHGYDTVNGALVLKGFISHVWPYSAGSLCSTASDLSLWLAALHGGRLLSADSYRAMTTPTSLADGTKVRYGFGVGVAQLGGRSAIFHGGGTNGFLSEVEFFSDSRLSVVVPSIPPDLSVDRISLARLWTPSSVPCPNAPRHSQGIRPRSQGLSRGSGVVGRLP